MQSIIAHHGLRNLLGRIGLFVVLMLGTRCAPSEPAIRVEPSPSALQIGHEGRLSVTVEDIADLTAFEVHLSFDAKTLEVIQLIDGGFIKADFIIQNTFDNAAGTIDYAVAQIDRPPASGSGTLFEILFRAKGAGTSPIHFRETPAAAAGALFSDSEGMAIQVLLINGSLKIAGF